MSSMPCCRCGCKSRNCIATFTLFQSRESSQESLDRRYDRVAAAMGMTVNAVRMMKYSTSSRSGSPTPSVTATAPDNTA
ncbi:hypothetical protein O3P69_020171 [Scylla paramamosain]|uniref:Uncharacterized protein n=1 Tax=Scylla paramamosain TaxID=85552 RepID=A0AAW0TKP5_SCYPA